MRKNFAGPQHPSAERGLRKLLRLSFRRRFYLPPQNTCQHTGRKKGEERGDSSLLPLFWVFSSRRALANASVNLQPRQMAEEEEEEEEEEDEFIWNL